MEISNSFVKYKIGEGSNSLIHKLFPQTQRSPFGTMHTNAVVFPMFIKIYTAYV